MSKLIIIKCNTDKDLINLMNDAIEDDLGFEVDLQSNILFTTDLELIIKGSKNIRESLSKGTITAKGGWIPYYLNMMPVYDGSYKIDVRTIIRSSSLEDPTDSLQYLNWHHRTGRLYKISVMDSVYREFLLPAIPVYLRNTTYKSTEIFYMMNHEEIQIELSPNIPFAIQQDLQDKYHYNQDQLNLLRDVLIHITNFSYPPIKKVDWMYI